MHTITHNLGLIFKILYILYRLCVIMCCWKWKVIANTTDSSSTILNNWNPQTLKTHKSERLVSYHKWANWDFGWLSPNSHCLQYHMILSLSLKCSNYLQNRWEHRIEAYQSNCVTTTVSISVKGGTRGSGTGEGDMGQGEVGHGDMEQGEVGRGDIGGVTRRLTCTS